MCTVPLCLLAVLARTTSDRSGPSRAARADRRGRRRSRSRSRPSCRRSPPEFPRRLTIEAHRRDDGGRTSPASAAGQLRPAQTCRVPRSGARPTRSGPRHVPQIRRRVPGLRTTTGHHTAISVPAGTTSDGLPESRSLGEGTRAQAAVLPPSTTNSAPARREARPVARERTRRGTTPPRAYRHDRALDVFCTESAPAVIGVATVPGCTELQRTPNAARSSAPPPSSVHARRTSTRCTRGPRRSPGAPRLTRH